MMEEFTIKGHDAFLRIALSKVHGFPEETCHWGGYDTESIVEITACYFNVKSTMCMSTGELSEFYLQLSNANETLSGDLFFKNYEKNLEINLKYEVNGHVDIKGSFWDFNDLENLEFHIATDQSYIRSTLTELKTIVEKYGGMQGVK